MPKTKCHLCGRADIDTDEEAVSDQAQEAYGVRDTVGGGWVDVCYSCYHDSTFNCHHCGEPTIYSPNQWETEHGTICSKECLEKSGLANIKAESPEEESVLANVDGYSQDAWKARAEAFAEVEAKLSFEERLDAFLKVFEEKGMLGSAEAEVEYEELCASWEIFQWAQAKRLDALAHVK